MGNRDPRVDAYISKAEVFAKPILNHLRELIFDTCLDVIETIKWSFPNYELKGPLCSIAAFKNHCSFGFWKAAILKDSDKVLQSKDGMGNLGKIALLQDLPSDEVLKRLLKQAMKLNVEGIKLPPRKKTNAADHIIPDEVLKALKKNKKALLTFENFSPSHKKEYIQWITEAKKELTRLKRITTMIEWLEEGRSRNWEYEKSGS
ncbi:hypothetical protein BH09BAC2_BH09BAC2_18900 [soil metagenome]